MCVDASVLVLCHICVGQRKNLSSCISACLRQGLCHFTVTCVKLADLQASEASPASASHLPVGCQDYRLASYPVWLDLGSGNSNSDLMLKPSLC